MYFWFWIFVICVCEFHIIIYSIINRPIENFLPEPEEIDSVIWVREYPDECDAFKNGGVIEAAIANHYARRGSHWRKFIHYKDPS